MIAPPASQPRASIGAVNLDDPAWQRAIDKARRLQPASDLLTNGPIGVRAWSGQGSQPYVVMQRTDGTWSCSCKAGRSGTPCYHAGHAYCAYVARPAYVEALRYGGDDFARWLYRELIPAEACDECRDYPAAAEIGRCLDCPPADIAA